MGKFSSLDAKVTVFKALAHPTRLRIIQDLAEGELCVCVLLESFPIDMSTLSRHLSVLKNAGVVDCEKRGKNVYYRLACPCLTRIFDCLDALDAGAKRCACGR